MDVSQIEETEYFDKALQMLCNSINQIMESKKINSTEHKQKMYAVASFLEFIKAGADINVETQKDNKISFIFNLK